MAYFSSQVFLESVKQELIFQHLTQASLGEKCGYSRKTINRIFNHPENVSFGQLDVIAKALRIKVGYTYSKE